MGILNDLKVALFLALKIISKGRWLFVLMVSILIFSYINLVFFSAFNNGMEEAINYKVINYNYGHIVIEPNDGEDFITGVSNLIKKIDSVEGIVGVASRIDTSAIFSSPDRSVSFMLMSINPIYENTVTQLYDGIYEGEFFTDNDETDEIVLGIELIGSEDLAFLTNPVTLNLDVGDYVNLKFKNNFSKDYRIKGSLYTQFWTSDYAAILPEKEIEKILGIEDVATSIVIRTSKEGMEEEVINKLWELGIPYKISIWEDKAGFSKDIVDSLRFVEILTKFVGFITAIASIFIVIYISTINKRKQIGILKALGTNKTIIINTFLIQTFLYSVTGLFIGYFIMKGIILYLTINPLQLPMGDVSPLLTLKTQLGAIFMLITACLLGGLIPAYRISKENIVKSLLGGYK